MAYNKKRIRTRKDDIRLTLDFILLSITVIGIILLCFAKSRMFMYGVFGYSIYAYIPIVSVYLLLSFTNLIRKFHPKDIFIFSLLIISIVAVIHVATLKSVIKDPLASYIMDPYHSANSAGGLFISIITYVFLAISRDYGFILACVFILMSIILLIAIYPIVLMIGRGSSKENKVSIKKNVLPEINSVAPQYEYDDDQVIPYVDDVASGYNVAHEKLFAQAPSSNENEERRLFSSIMSNEDARRQSEQRSRDILFSKDINKEQSVDEKPTFSTLDAIANNDIDKMYGNNYSPYVVTGASISPESSQDRVQKQGGSILFPQNDQINDAKFIKEDAFPFGQPVKPMAMNDLFGEVDRVSDEELEAKRKEKQSALDYFRRPMDSNDFESFEKTSQFTSINSSQPDSNRIVYVDPREEKKVEETTIVSKVSAEDVVATKSEQMTIDDYISKTEKVSTPATKVEKTEPIKPKIKTKYCAPPSTLLSMKGEAFSDFPSDYDVMKHKIELTMEEFGVPAIVINAKQGPTFTRYELSLGQGYKVQKINSLMDNLKMRLAVGNIRLLAPIAGKDAFGLEIPNRKRSIVDFRTLIESERYKKQSDGIDLCFGMTNEGGVFIEDLTAMPHLLVAGASGTGKSVFLNCVINSILYKYSPDDVRMVLIDPKRVELSKYRSLPNLLVADTVKDFQEAVNALQMLVREMDRRYKVLEEAGCVNIGEYNRMFPNDKMYKIVLIVDEMADLMMKSKGNTDVEDSIVRLAQLARASGIHMIIATQRPIVDVITGLIKSNILCRVAFTVQNATDSRIILDSTGAEELLGYGDMIYSSPKGMTRMQGAFIDPLDITSICNFIRDNNLADFDQRFKDEVTYVPVVEDDEPALSVEDKQAQKQADDEEMAQKFLRYFITKNRASISTGQTKFSVGFIRAKRIFEMLEERGYLGPPTTGSQPRTVAITLQELDELIESGKF